MSLTIVNVHHDRKPGIWKQAYADRAVELRGLAVRLEEEALACYGGLSLAGATRAASALNARFGGPFRSELRDLASLFQVTLGEVLLMNVLYDVAAGGCSTVLVPTAHGPLHARNLDWEFPENLLRDHLVAVKVSGAPAGPYLNLTWPGLCGALTAVAPRRFSISVNFVRSDASTPWRFLQRVLYGYWPTTWVVRQALEQDATFDQVVKRLSETALLAPVLFAVAGTHNHERVIIERTPLYHAQRWGVEHHPLFVTNHYCSKKLKHHGRVLGDELLADSQERYAVLDKHCGTSGFTPVKLFQLLERDDLQSEITQHAVVMGAALAQCLIRLPNEAPAVAALDFTS